MAALRQGRLFGCAPALLRSLLLLYLGVGGEAWCNALDFAKSKGSHFDLILFLLTLSVLKTVPVRCARLLFSRIAKCRFPLRPEFRIRP